MCIKSKLKRFSLSSPSEVESVSNSKVVAPPPPLSRLPAQMQRTSSGDGHVVRPLSTPSKGLVLSPPAPSVRPEGPQPGKWRS